MEWHYFLFMVSQHSDGELNQIQLKEEADMVCDDDRDTPSDLEEYVMVPAQLPSKRSLEFSGCIRHQSTGGLTHFISLFYRWVHMWGGGCITYRELHDLQWVSTSVTVSIWWDW